MNLTASKVMWGKTLNSGQVCIAPDYVFVHEKRLKEFVEACQGKLTSFFGEENKKLSPYQGRIVNKFHTERLKKAIDTCQGQIICGGKVDVEKQHVQPTLVLEPKKDSILMTEEIFGCVLPIFPYSSINEVIEFINSKDKPLTVYYFGSYGNPNMDRVREQTSSGHLMQNEMLYQFCTNY